MQSARNNAAIPIPERQKRVGPHVCAGTNVLPEGPPNLTHPQLAEADYDPTGDSLLLDNGFWELFELEDLNEAHSVPPASLHDSPFPSAGLIQPLDPTHIPFINSSSIQNYWDGRGLVQDRSVRDLDTNFPAADNISPGNGCVNHSDFYRPRLSEQVDESSGNLWLTRSNQVQGPLWNSYVPTFAELESLPRERLPSLETDLSSGSFSFENPLDVAAVFGASHWPGMIPFNPAKTSDTTKAGEMTFPVEQASDSHSWGLEPLSGSSPDAVTTVIEADASQAPSLFDFGSKLTDSRVHYPFIDQSTASNIPKPNQFNYDIYSQVGNRYISAKGLSCGEHYSSDRTDLTPSGMPSWRDLPQYNLQESEEASSSQIHISVGMSEGYEQPHQDHNISWNCFVAEDGSGNATTPPFPHRKGTRHGRLPPDKARVTAERRRQGKTCMRCRVARVECDGRDPCQRCTKMGQSSSLNHPCIKANFLDIVKSGTCNYISQRAINHFTLDESRRIKMFLPEAFDVNQLLNLLDKRRQTFNIRARQASGSLYVLDLEKCYDFLDNIRRNSTISKTGGLRSFIDDTLVKTESWYKCVKECDPTRNKTLLLSQWNNMPSRASYDLVPLSADFPERPLDPESEEDRREILIAAQLSRIVCRKLEIDGYKALQAEINNMRSTNSTSESRKNEVEKVGKILLSLRWRMSWWKLLGDGSNNDDLFRDRFVGRVEHLAKVLYFYYFTLKSRIGSWNDLSGLRGEMSSYPDATPVFDDFPTVSSIQGFEEWLERGKVLIRQANVERRFSR